jgi:hypothetical protein
MARRTAQARASAPEGSAVAKPARLHEQLLSAERVPQEEDRARLYAEIAAKSRSIEDSSWSSKRRGAVDGQVR